MADAVDRDRVCRRPPQRRRRRLAAIVARVSAILAREAVALSELVERILLFVHTRERRHHYTLEPVDLGDIAAAVLASTAALAHSVGIAVESRIDPAVPLIVADRAALVRGLENLVING